MQERHSPTCLRGLLLAVASTSLVILLSGCNSSTAGREAEWTAPEPVSFEQVTGADGEHLGWVRTDRATKNGGTYEVILDPDMNVVGYTGLPGRHYAPAGRDVDFTGNYSRSNGLGKVFNRRPVDVGTTPTGHARLLRSGPLWPQAATEEPAAAPDGDDDDGDDDDYEDDDEE